MELLMAIFGIVLGLMVFIGFLAFQAVFLIPVPCSTFGCPTLTSDQAAYQGAVHALAWLAIIALDLSVGLSITIAFVLGSRSDISDTTRRSAFYFATIYLAAYTVFGSLFLGSLFTLIRFL